MKLESFFFRKKNMQEPSGQHEAGTDNQPIKEGLERVGQAIYAAIRELKEAEEKRHAEEMKAKEVKIDPYYKMISKDILEDLAERYDYIHFGDGVSQLRFTVCYNTKSKEYAPAINIKSSEALNTLALLLESKYERFGMDAATIRADVIENFLLNSQFTNEGRQQMEAGFEADQLLMETARMVMNELLRRGFERIKPDFAQVFRPGEESDGPAFNIRSDDAKRGLTVSLGYLNDKHNYGAQALCDYYLGTVERNYNVRNRRAGYTYQDWVGQS